jgi:AraC-like DNA-binding protein
MSSARDGLLRAKDRIDAHYSEPLDVRGLARTAGLSEAHFSRQFHRAFGESPHQYVIARRMSRAAALLVAGDRPIAEICRSVGLRSIGSFTTMFGRRFGVSPGAYRSARSGSAATAPLPQRADEDRQLNRG